VSVFFCPPSFRWIAGGQAAKSGQKDKETEKWRLSELPSRFVSSCGGPNDDYEQERSVMPLARSMIHISAPDFLSSRLLRHALNSGEFSDGK
ncbi:MAG TPA: hypothetical protein VGH74_09935, partial [Planctomycetaceae bacterium]